MRHDTRSRNAVSNLHPQPADWIQKEIADCVFPDARLAKRFGSLLGMISHGVGDSIPAACQDWSNTKAAYRFFSNSRVSEREILGGHFQSTKARCVSVEGVLLVLHDTSESCVHIGDRESDIYELFCLAQDLGIRFVIRTLCRSTRKRWADYHCGNHEALYLDRGSDGAGA